MQKSYNLYTFKYLGHFYDMTSAAKRHILITYALPYANGSIHLGHMVGYIQADIWARFQQLRGHSCYYICGDDAHGTPIMLRAEKQGITPEELIAQMGQEHRTDFADFAIAFDNFYTTHSKENQELAGSIYQRLQSGGFITEKTISQAYDPVKGMFLPDRYVKGTCPRCKTADQYGDNCEACGATYQPTELIDPISAVSGATPIQKKSKHYFFNLPAFEKELHAWTRSGALQPEVTNKLDEWFKAGLNPWDISRDAPYFGFLIPGTTDKYFYVWLDAPIGYMASFKEWCSRHPDVSFDDYWQKDSTYELYHFIGKDIMYFHTLFWPAMLSGAGLRTPNAIYAHGFLTVNGQKMSKSRGTFIKARSYLNHLPADCLRYYFATKLNSRIEDLDLNMQDFLGRVNSDLVGKWVNIASRCAGFLAKNFNNQLASELDQPELFAEFSNKSDEIAALYENREFSAAMREIMLLADKANQYIDNKKPWILAKDPAQLPLVQRICTLGINLFRVLSLYLKPIFPHTTLKIETFLNAGPLTWEIAPQALLNQPLQPFNPLLQRIEQEQINAMLEEAKQDLTAEATAPIATKTPLNPIHAEITIDDFVKVDLRIAKILDAKTVEGSDKLLQLTVDIGLETRNIFAGIKASYTPEQLIGKFTVIVANLAPRKMRFGVSEGMVTVACDPSGEKVWLLEPQAGVEPGMRVK